MMVREDVLDVRWLGPASFTDALRLQEEIVAQKRGDPSSPDQLLLLEHEPVYTIGRTPDQTSLRGASHLPHLLFQTNRGGQATFHGPGQLIGYPIVDLRNCGLDLHKYLRWIEELLITFLTRYSLQARRRDGLTGVWVENRKIASIGVGVRHWITMHGFALNVCGDLSPFAHITPCGIAEVAMTSIEKECGESVTVAAAAAMMEELALSAIAGLRATPAPQHCMKPNTPLEDNFADVISKAQRGLGLSDSEVAKKARIDASALRKLRGGQFDELALFRVAPVLGLGGRALCDLAQEQYQPAAHEIEGLAMFNTPFHDMRVNAFLVWDPKSREAVAFDSGADCAPMLAHIKKENLAVKFILLTHAHPDHVADLAKLAKATAAPIYISERESAPGAEAISEGKTFEVGRLKISSLLTWGHSRGGMTFYVTGLSRPVAIVGDSIFAGSMGGGNVSYQEALKNNLKKILTLPDDTIISPGHGPLTTVGEEKENNPFFAGQLSS